jgi:hypothetical protein
MKTGIKALLFVIPLLVGTAQVKAQHVVGGRYTYVTQVPSGVSSAPTYLPSVAGYATIPRPTVGTTYVPPYSYYVVPNPYATRYYSGYGNNDFPFYGKPYGRPTDAWTWPYMSHGYYNQMARYYSPPL